MNTTRFAAITLTSRLLNGIPVPLSASIPPDMNLFKVDSPKASNHTLLLLAGAEDQLKQKDTNNAFIYGPADRVLPSGFAEDRTGGDADQAGRVVVNMSRYFQ
jgi:hypothetical protein